MKNRFARNRDGSQPCLKKNKHGVTVFSFWWTNGGRVVDYIITKNNGWVCIRSTSRY